MNIYIQSIGCVSPKSNAATVQKYDNALQCASPDLSEFLDAKLTRRMSHVTKMGIAASMEALQKANVKMPDAIVIGTAYGCLDDTGVFLKKQVLQNETMLTPTAFIQSTHNTVGGQIGLTLHCHAYNNTFVHGAFSFEHALQDAVMLLQDNEANQVLVGGVDEITEASHTLLSRFGLYRNGAVTGEGATFFVLGSATSVHNCALLKAVSTLYKPLDADAVISHLQLFLATHSLSANDIDIIIAGKNGDAAADEIYNKVLIPVFGNKSMVTFKDECGDYPTASAYGLYKAVSIIQENEAKNVLIYNHYLNKHHTFQLIEAC